MSEKTYRLKITAHDEDWSCNGFVGQSVIDKIKNLEFVEFNLLIKYTKENEAEIQALTAHYQRFHWSPVKNMDLEIEEVTSEEVFEQCSN